MALSAMKVRRALRTKPQAVPFGRPSIRVHAVAHAPPAPVRDQASQAKAVFTELQKAMKGLERSTRRVRVTNTGLLDATAEIVDRPCSTTHTQRCKSLNMSLAWEAAPSATTSAAYEALKPITGTATVSLGSVDEEYGGSKDVMKMSVNLDSAQAPPELLADVVYAVQGLESAIMERLNDFLWNMESRGVAADSGAAAPSTAA